MITTPLQSLRFDTLNIALFYGIRPIASGSFIIDIFLDTKRPHQLTTNFPPELYAKNKFGKNTHENTHQSKSLRGSAICLRPRGVIQFPSLLLTNIEYNGTSLNRSSLISQTQALNSLYIPLKCLVKKNSLNFVNTTKCSH